ncbi:MAG: hypothetical protein AAB726_02735 [Patescibacteria group bacterium]
MNRVIVSVVSLGVFLLLVYGAVSLLRMDHEDRVSDITRTSEVLTAAGAKDGGFVVIERQLGDGEKRELVFFVLYTERAATSGQIAMVDGEFTREIDSHDKIIKVVDRGDPEYGKYADGFVREWFWDRRPFADGVIR